MPNVETLRSSSVAYIDVTAYALCSNTLEPFQLCYVVTIISGVAAIADVPVSATNNGSGDILEAVAPVSGSVSVTALHTQPPPHSDFDLRLVSAVVAGHSWPHILALVYAQVICCMLTGVNVCHLSVVMSLRVVTGHWHYYVVELADY